MTRPYETAAKRGNNFATAGSTIGSALGVLIVWLGPQWGWFDPINSDVQAASIAGAMGVVITWLARKIERLWA